jgi:4-methylaminobutanoate oxidase (formaldehyde-forming)
MYRENSVIQDAEAVVVGAGALGASVAYHLAHGAKNVVLVDRFDVASQTSPRAAGLSQQIRADPITTRLAMRGVQMLERFSEDTGEPLIVHQSGSIKMARTPAGAAQVARDITHGQALGLEIKAISEDEARRLAPFFEPAGALALWYTASDVFLEPGDLPRAYARAAARLGATVLPRTTVTAIGTRDGRIEQVVTTTGTIRTPVVIDTAGAWNGLVAAMTGIRVPIVPTRHQLYITEPIVGIVPEQPIVRVLEANVYVRPERGGLMLGGYEPDPLQVDMRKLPADYQIGDLALDFEPLRTLTQDVSAQFPVLQNAAIAELRGGLPTMTADGDHIIDRVPGVEGFFVVGGCCVGGLTISPAVGELVAKWVVEGEPPMDVSRFRLSRFGAEVDSDERLRAACLWRYAHHYSAAGREEAPEEAWRA